MSKTNFKLTVNTIYEKLFFLTIVILSITVCGNAQILFSEDFENDSLLIGWTLIDADGDNMYWKHSSDTMLGFGYGHNSNYCIFSQSYDNDLGALTPDNWIITPAIQLTEVANMLTFWVCAQDAEFSAEHFGVYISTTSSTDTSAFTLLDEWTIGGAKVLGSWEQKAIDLSNYSGTVYLAFRHFNSSNQFFIDIDDIVVSAIPTHPTFNIETTHLNFSNVALGSSKTLSFPITALSLSSDITLSVTAPFTVSSDNITFGATATITAAPLLTSNSVYVRYTPIAVNRDSSRLTILSANADTITVNVFGNGVDCSIHINEIPYTENFESEDFPPKCWDIDYTDESSTWESFDYGNLWAECPGSVEYSVEKLITPPFDFSNYSHTILMDFDFMSNYAFISSGFADLKIYASTDGGNTFEDSAIWKLSNFGHFSNFRETTATVNLSNLSGQPNVKFAFTYEGARAQILFDNIHIYPVDTPTILLDKDMLTFSAENGESHIKSINVTTYNLTEDITVTTNTPFSVSMDNTEFSNSTVIPASGGPLYVKYTAEYGVQTDNVIFTSSNITKTLHLTGNGLDCSVPMDLPFSENFENELSACWQNIDLDEDGYAWTDNSEFEMPAHSGTGIYASASYLLGVGALNPENWLITPTIYIPETGATLSFWVAAQSPILCEEYYEVLVSTTGNELSEFVPIHSNTLSSNEWVEQTLSLQPYADQNINIAFVHKDVTNMFYLKLDDISITPNVGIPEFENEANIYPNPSNDILHVNTSSNIHNISIFNMMGQQVATYDANDTYIRINTSNLNNGIYLISIKTDNGTINRKFTVTR